MLQCVLVWPVVESIRALQWRVCRLWRPQAAALAEQLAGRQGAGGAAAAQDASVARVAELEARQVLRPPGLGLPGGPNSQLAFLCIHERPVLVRPAGLCQRSVRRFSAA